jgi:hypothetical protein
MVLVNGSVCCGVNVGRQFPLTADICAMVVVLVNVCSQVGTWERVVDVKKADFFFQLQS